MIVDTSALIAVLRGEPEARQLLAVMLRESVVRMSSATLLETRIVAEREGRGGSEVDELIAEAGIDIVPPDLQQIEFAFEGFQRFGKGRHPAGLNFGDLFAYALARSAGEPLLFKGADFGQTDVESAIK